MKSLRYVKLRTFAREPLDIAREQNHNPLRVKVEIKSLSKNFNSTYLEGFKRPLDFPRAVAEPLVINFFQKHDAHDSDCSFLILDCSKTRHLKGGLHGLKQLIYSSLLLLVILCLNHGKQLAKGWLPLFVKLLLLRNIGQSYLVTLRKKTMQMLQLKITFLVSSRYVSSY